MEFISKGNSCELKEMGFPDPVGWESKSTLISLRVLKLSFSLRWNQANNVGKCVKI